MNVLPRTRRRTWFASGLTGVLTAGAVFAVVAGYGGVGSPARAAEQAPSSALTVTARDQDPALASAPFPQLSVTVSQTEALQQQAVTVSWTGMSQSSIPTSADGGQNFVQVFQCWGDDPKNPGRPDRTTCQYGGTAAPGAARNHARASAEAVASEDEQYTVPARSWLDPTYTSIPFRAVDGTVVTDITTDAKGNKSVDPSISMDNNQFFTAYTTNEVPWGGSGVDGKGSLSFEIQTVAQSNALGCGTTVVAKDGTVSGSACWLVVVPRGVADNGQPDTRDSGLFWDSWQHALSVRLHFQPIGQRCPIGQTERQVAGSELLSVAMSSWQPVVCNTKGGSVFSLLTTPESDALSHAAGTAPAPAAVTSFPLSATAGSDSDSLTYAPVALTGISIAFSIDGNPDPDNPQLTDAQRATAQRRFTSMNLTPRLLAKLLTNSYISSLPPGSSDEPDYLTASSAKRNPMTLLRDPDFLKVNPDWVGQSLADVASIADIQVPQGRSDAANALWTYITADSDARDFLAGHPDPWGMRVNPWSSTDATVNPSHTGVTYPREDFPKADPIDIAATAEQGEINLVAWRPFTNSLDQSGYLTLRGDGQLLGSWDVTAHPPKFGKTARQLPGFQKVLGLTTTASAARYRVMQASLLNAAGKFVAPTAATMASAASAMTKVGANEQVLGYVSDSSEARSAADAYPLTLPVYAAVNPAMTDAAARASYANLIRYAVTSGQVPGADPGLLPDGYAPLSQQWVEQALKAADAIQNGVVPQAVVTAYIPSQNTAAGGTRAAAATAASSAAVASSGTTPSASGTPALALSGSKTPADPDLGPSTIVVPVSLLAGAFGAGAVPLITRLRRRVT